jgi:phosphopantothenoylcysteine decarboxylase/phosphopantothenate--cysteine ligase
MGLAIADELFAMGADVLLLHTMLDLERPYRVIRMDSAQDMAMYTIRNFKEADGIVMAAAVSDFQLADTQRTAIDGKKIKKQSELTLQLVATPDILGEIGPQKTPEQFVVGFAAESDHLLMHAREKLERKQLDMIVANDISRQDIGFGSDHNEVTLLFKDKDRIDLPRSPKFWIARQILVHLYQKYLAKREAEPDTDPVASTVSESPLEDL